MQLLYLDPQHIERDPTGVREEDGDLSGLIETIREQGADQGPDFARLEAGCPLGEGESRNRSRVFQLRSLSRALEEIAAQQGWDLATD